MLICLNCRKMFIGGLNWETTDGEQCTELMQEAEHVLILVFRFPEGVLLTVRRGYRVHGHARRRYWSVTRLWLFDIQRPEDGQCCYGQGALLGWQDRKRAPTFQPAHLTNTF